jgi:hypothetical protein
MALSTYAELQASIASWLARDDLTDYIPDFIRLFEAKAARVLRVRPMEVTETLEPDEGEVELPADYQGHRRLTWLGDVRVELEYVSPAYLQTICPTLEEDTPRFYTIEGGNILIRPVDDTDLEFVYYAKNEALEDSLNWLLTNHPDAYLFGSLAEAHGFQVDEGRLQLWAMRRDEVLEEIRQLRFNEPSSIGTVQVLGSTP